MNQTVYRGHPAWRAPVMIKFMLASVFCSVIIGAALVFAASHNLVGNGYAALGMFLLLAFLSGSVSLYRTKTLYLVTGRGVRFESGFPVKTNKREFSYHKIQAVDVHQSLTEKLLLHTGTVTVSSAASDLSQDDIVFAGVAKPDWVAQLIREGEDRASGHYDEPEHRYSRPPMPLGADDSEQGDYGYGSGGYPPRRSDGLPPR